MKQVIKTTRPKIPAGHHKFKHCTGGYKRTILGTEVESDTPVWAERRTSPIALFASDRVWYRLYTYLPN